MGGTYHFVCHECAEEGVYDDQSAAEDVREVHVEETDHRVSLRKIADRPA